MKRHVFSFYCVNLRTPLENMATANRYSRQETRDDIAEDLYEDVPVFCWVMTCSENLIPKAKHVQNTWGKRCNKIVYMSDENNDTFPAISSNTTGKGRSYLAFRTSEAFDYIFKNHFDDADWFLKADDDTYVIIENLRHFLRNKSSSEPIFFGHNFVPHVRQGYASGGAGYVLSKEALRRYGRRNKNTCPPALDLPEDVMIGRCMEALDVTLGDSRDDLGRTRFNCFDPVSHANHIYPKWYSDYVQFDTQTVNMSDYPISFHYIEPAKMYELGYFVYHQAVSK